jgi:amino acid permease
MLGLCVLYYFDIFTLATKGVADITLFNKNDYVLFLGTAAFAFEGIGLVIPIQESMARPEKFKFVLTGVMIILILVFTSIGALSYAAYGSAVKTVIISSLPQDSGTSHWDFAYISFRQCSSISVFLGHLTIYAASIIPCNSYPGKRNGSRPSKWKTKPLY